MLGETERSTTTTIVPVKLPNGVIVQVEAAHIGGGETDIAARDLAFETAAKAIEGIAGTLAATLQKVNPHKASVELQFDLSVESGQLTALFVKGSGKGTIKITLEWEGATQTNNPAPPAQH
jgi:hypothetical protein